MSVETIFILHSSKGTYGLPINVLILGSWEMCSWTFLSKAAEKAFISVQVCVIKSNNVHNKMPRKETTLSDEEMEEITKSLNLMSAELTLVAVQQKRIMEVMGGMPYATAAVVRVSKPLRIPSLGAMSKLPRPIENCWSNR